MKYTELNDNKNRKFRDLLMSGIYKGWDSTMSNEMHDLHNHLHRIFLEMDPTILKEWEEEIRKA